MGGISEEHKIVYLDCDLMVGLDVRKLYDLDLGEYVLGASGGGFVESALEHNVLYASSPAGSPLGGKIVHFVGTPNPWDRFANILHGNFEVWKSAAARTEISIKPWSHVGLSSIYRLVRIVPSVIRQARARARH